MSKFNNKVLMITGGTGSFGHTVLKHFLTTDIGQIRIFSRDEKKQDDTRHELQANYPEYADKVKFYIGDVRNIQSLPANSFRWKQYEPMWKEQIIFFMLLSKKVSNGSSVFLPIRLLILSMPWVLPKP